MRKIILIGILLLILFGGKGGINLPVRADELEDINSKLSELTATLQSSEKATATNEKQLTSLTSQLASIKSQVVKIEQDVIQKEKDIKTGEERLLSQKKILDERVASFYKQKGKSNDAMLQILVSDNLTKFLKQFTYQQNLLDADRKTIVRVVLFVKDIEEKKVKLEDEKERLIPIKEQIDEQSAFLEGEVLSAKKYENSIKSEIVSLSARQQQILSQRLSSLNIPRSAGTSARGCSDDRGIDPGFSPRIAFFTYGAPHRNGLNQYGAKGRADTNQSSYTDILNAYYTDYQLSDYNTDTTIIVNGVNEYGQTFENEPMNLEDYTKHLYEMPSGWPIEALKAQAVAARTYALRIMKVHGAVKPNQGHQVVKKEANAQSWIDAVDQTRGKVMLRGGEPFLSEYASTHGGYVLNIGKFDGRDGNPGSWSELNDRAYDKESPWFYCDWGSRSEYAKTAWLKPEEVADIFNTLMLVKADSSTAENLYQIDKPNPAGKETWSIDKVKSELRNKGGSPFDSISDISVSADFGSGRSTTITVNGQSFSSSEFKDRFNLRAPANLQIVGPLFNVERK